APPPAPVEEEQPAAAEPAALDEVDGDPRPGRGRLGSFLVERPTSPVAFHRAFDAVLFDFAGVVVASPYPALAGMAASVGLDGGDVLDLTVGPQHRDTDHPFHRLERGEISPAQYDEELAVRLEGARAPITYDVIRNAFAGLDVNEVVIEYLEELRADGYRTALISNNFRDIAFHWKQMLPLHQLFDLVIDSSAYGIRKPNPAIYRLALDKLGGIQPQRSVYVDDGLGNVEGARSIGMHGVHVVRDPGFALRQIDTLLGRSTAGGEELDPEA
ncbi:MAG: HAD family phosphatase, partial [Acidimicrobiia bacterium]|nr:HAD family phosphatase [Acidimicrobiia bacterium]